ncbi:MAG: hypothetical protein QOH06_3370 [Acidobacteriota bacterium]|jgi:serine/threonine protein kinase|nr:hypothetical protein [Acidobacteriota bacterium]
MQSRKKRGSLSAAEHFDVFLSYSRKDISAAQQIARALVERGFRPWLDVEELRPGKPWQEEVEKIISTVRAAAVLVGQEGMGPWQNREMRALLGEFLDRGLPVIPVLLPGIRRKPKLPPFLKDFAWIDFREGFTDSELERFVFGITGTKSSRSTDQGPGSVAPLPQTAGKEAERQALCDELDAAYEEKERLVSSGQDTGTLEAKILELHRRLREGPQLNAGEILYRGRFRLLAEIGKGSFGTVWRVYDRRDKVEVAIKVLHGQHVRDQTRQERFFRGAREMAQLHHQGIVRVIEQHLEDEGYHFFVMEYMGAGDFRQAVLENRLTQDERLRVIKKVGEALQFAHEHGVIHRDVKPANILLDSNSIPKLADFDLVRALDSTGGTRTEGLGTWIYAAPEAMESAKNVGAAADVFSLGMTVIFALCGRDLGSAVFRDTRSFVKGLSCPHRLKEAILKAVAWEPAERFASVADFLEALTKALTIQALSSTQRGLLEVPELRRSIVIGLGGTGRQVCTQLKRLLLERSGNDRGGFPHVRFLSIDTDIRVRRVQEQIGNIVQLDTSEMLGLKIPLLLNRDRVRNFISDRVASFLPYANEKGAMRCRPIGHAFLVTNWHVIQDRLRAIYSELENANLRELVRINPRFHDRILDSQRTDIYVIGNLVSGTGSGMALGTGYLLRDLLFELDREDEDHIEGIFTTCGTFALAEAAGQPSPYAVNCYASLLELSHYASPSIHKNHLTAYSPGFDEVKLVERVSQKPPYDHVQLLNPSHSATGSLEIEKFEPKVAEILALRTGSILGMMANARIIDEWRAQDKYDQHDNQRFCWAWGAQSFSSSGQTLDRRLIEHLESAEPAINLDTGIGSDSKTRSYISVPAGVPLLRNMLVESEWLQERAGNNSAESLVEERVGDEDPRINVLTVRFPFSPAAIVCVDKWAQSYKRAAASSAGHRDIHTVPNIVEGKKLVFKPLCATEAQPQAVVAPRAAQPESQEEPALRRAIVIGLGGSGRNVCTQLKRILLERNGNDRNRLPHIAFLSIDTGPRSKVVTNRTVDEPQLDHSEILRLSIPPSLHYSRLRSVISARLASFLARANEEGTTRCRPIGHAFLVTNWRLIKDRLRAIYSELQDANLRELVRIDPRYQGRRLDSRQTDIYIVGNLVSGTGSGMALGTGYLLRDFLFELGRENDDSIEGIFTTCGTFALADVAGQPSPYAVNCYASLLELNHYSTPRIYKSPLTAYTPVFGEVTLAGKVRQKPPYDRIQLLNPSHSSAGDLTAEAFEPQIAEVLALRTASILGMTANAAFIDQLAYSDRYDLDGNQRFCSAWGAKSFKSSRKDILDLAAALTAVEILNALTGENVRSVINCEAAAHEILTSIGCGHAVEDESSRKNNTGLLVCLLTPREPLEDGAKGAVLLDSIYQMILAAFPVPPEDSELLRGLPAQLDRFKQEISARISGLIASVVGQNGRLLALQTLKAVTRQIEDLGDFSLDGRGSLCDAISIIDLLVGTEDSSAGMLRQENEQYQVGAHFARAEMERARMLAESNEHLVRKLSATAGKFEYEALVGAWKDFVSGLTQQKQYEARCTSLEAAHRILGGDTAGRDAEVRIGLIKHLEQLRIRLRSAHQQLKALDALFEGEVKRLSSQLAQGEFTSTTSMREGHATKEELLDGHLLQLYAAEIVDRIIGKPYLAELRYKNVYLVQQDCASILQLIRDKASSKDSVRLLRSIEADPTFGGHLTAFLETGEPAIKLDFDCEGERKEIAYVSIPEGAVNLQQTLAKSAWLRARSAGWSAEDLIQEQPRDNDPRVDVITAIVSFSPAAIIGIDMWAECYGRATAKSADKRDVHAIPDSSSGKGLTFEPLGATKARLQVAYLIALSMEWLRPMGIGSIYSYVDRKSQFAEEVVSCYISVRLGDLDFFTAFRNPLVVGAIDPNERIPIFLHVLLRFQALMSRDDNDEERKALFERLVIGITQLLKKTGALNDDPLLPQPADRSQFTAFEQALSYLLMPLGLFDDIHREIENFLPASMP